jgi:hypothetical protein
MGAVLSSSYAQSHTAVPIRVFLHFSQDFKKMANLRLFQNIWKKCMKTFINKKVVEIYSFPIFSLDLKIPWEITFYE